MSSLYHKTQKDDIPYQPFVVQTMRLAVLNRLALNQKSTKNFDPAGLFPVLRTFLASCGAFGSPCMVFTRPAALFDNPAALLGFLQHFVASLRCRKGATPCRTVQTPAGRSASPQD